MYFIILCEYGGNRGFGKGKNCWIGHGIKCRHELHEKLVKEDYISCSQKGYAYSYEDDIPEHIKAYV